MSGGVAVDFSALSKAGASLAEGLEKQRTQSLLQALGGQVQSGDYAGAAKTAFDAGDLQTGLSLVKLGEQKTASAQYNSQFGNLGALMGGQQPDAVTGTPSTVKAPSFTDASGPAGAYLATLRGKESGGNATAKNPNSTATGIDQFTRQTWDGLRTKYPELGLTADGRTDPAQSTRAMEKFTADNARALTSAGVPITPGNLYVSHFLGEAGGPRFIRGTMQNPDAPATAYVTPGAAAANRTIFYNRDGSPKTAGQVYAERTSKFGGASAPTRVSGTNPDAPATRTQVASADPSFMPQVPNASARAAPAAPAPTATTGGAPMILPPEADTVQPEQRTQVAQAAPQILAQAGMKPAAAAQVQQMQPGSAQRIQFYLRAATHPGGTDAQREIAKTMLSNELQLDRENKQTTAEQKEYWFDVAQGFKGDPMAWRAAKAAATRAPERSKQDEVVSARANWQKLGLPDPSKPENDKFWQAYASRATGGGALVENNITNGGAEGKQDQIVQEDFGKRQIAIRDANSAASSSLGSIRVMKQLVDDPSFYSGTFGGLTTEAKKALASVGLGAADGARANEGFRKLSSQFILDKAGGSLGGGFSNGDRAFIEQTGPNIENTPAGNKLILEMAERTALRQQEIARQMTEYKKTHSNRIDDGFLTQIDRFAEANPVFAGLENMPGVKAPATQQPQGAPRAGQRDASASGPLKTAPASEIGLAKAAIASGVPAEKVMQKMRARGFDPSGL